MDVERVRRRVRLRDLEILSAVVHSGGMHRASQALNVSQPAVSKSIRALESAIGLQLLERGGRGIEPTLFGESLARRSQTVFDDLVGALRELADLADPEAGEAKLGSTETLAAGLVSETVARLARSHPRMRLLIESGGSNDLVELFLKQRLIDFAVARPSSPLTADVDGEPLFSDRMRLMVGPDHPFARRRRLTLAELSEARWILSRNELSSDSPIVAAFGSAGLELPQRVVVTSSLNTRYHLLRSGSFVSAVPHSLLSFLHPRPLRLLPIELPSWRTPTMILTLRHRTLSPAARAFLDTLRELALPLATEK